MSSIQKNVASQNITFCLIVASTGAALTGASPSGYVTKDGTQAAAGGTFTELKVSGTGYGAYNYAPTQAETNCTNFGLLVTASTAIPVNLDFHTDVVDGNGLLQVDLVDIAGSAVSTSSAQLGVNVVNINAQTATAAAGVTFPASIASPTNITAGTITTVTNLTNAPTSGDLTSTMKTSVTTAVNAATTVGITSNRKKGATATFEVLMQDATTGAPKTGLSPAATISKDGGAPGTTANAVTEIGLGQYQIVLTNNEMTANNIFLQFTATGRGDNKSLNSNTIMIMAKILKWWHQYGFLVTIIGYIFMMGTIWQSHKDAIASIQTGIDSIQEQHNKENIDHRVTILEQIASDNRDNFSQIRDTEKAIFSRINEIGDKSNGR